jgi:uracil-DNA glycosylase family 4
MKDGIMDEMEEDRKHPLAKCEECPWRDEAGFADATGPEEASIIVVGEAPGAVETRTGVPFTGPSGQLLDRVLRHHNIDRDAVRFTNVAACHPPYKPGVGSVVPPKEVVAACLPRLKAEVAGRDTIVLLGNTAKEAILETKEGITSIRTGPPKSSDKYPGVKIIPTIHPAACLRQSDSFPSLVKDIGKINATTVQFEPPVYRTFDDAVDALAVLRELCTKYDTFTLDIEVGVDKDTDFTHPDELLCIGLGYAPGKAIVIGEQALLDGRVRDFIRVHFARKKIICHNGKFDIQVLMRLGYLEDPYCLWFDTMLASYACDERPGHHGLKYILAEEFGWPDYDSEIKKYTGTGANSLSYAVVPRDVLYKYNAYDAAGTFIVYEHYVNKMNPATRSVHDRLVMYSHELIYVELEGVGFDLEYNQYLYDHFESLLLPAEAQMKDLTGVPTFNPRSPIQVKDALHNWGVRVADTTADTLKNVFERIDPETELGRFLEILLQHKLDQKSYSTYVKGLRKRVQKDGRIYSTFLLHGTVTGRTASRNPNVQNVTRGAVLRKQFVPAAGHVFVQCDYGQIEGRVMAVEADEKFLLDIFRDPTRDLFDELGTPLYGSLEAAQKKENRVRTKAYFYGMGYGREAHSIAMEYKLPTRQVERDMARFFGNMPNLTEWREGIMKQARASALETHFNRKRRFWLVTRDNAKDVEKEGLAFIPQSTANDINLTALCRIRKAGLHVRIPVHDSIMVECPEEDKLEVAHFMCKTMEETAAEIYSDKVPFPVDYEFGYNWGELSEE